MFFNDCKGEEKVDQNQPFMKKPPSRGKAVSIIIE